MTAALGGVDEMCTRTWVIGDPNNVVTKQRISGEIFLTRIVEAL